MADQTTLPTCAVGSLGGAKLDRRTAIDPKRDEPAAEIMLRNACIAELFRRMGLSAGAAAGSYEARVAALEAADGDGLDLFNPQTHFKADDFDDWTALSSPGWDNGGGMDPWTVLLGTRGGLSAAIADECYLKTAGAFYNAYQYPHCRFVCKVDAWDEDLGSQFLSVMRLAADDTIAYGVRVYDYTAAGIPPLQNRRIQGVVCDGGGLGGVTATDICDFADNTNYDIHWWIALDGGSMCLFVSVNGAPAVNCGIPAGGTDQGYIAFTAPHKALSASVFYLYQVRRKALWTPPGVPGMVWV